MSDGRRKAELSEAVNAVINTDFRDRVEPFDVLAADQYAVVVSGREQAGQPISISDAQIAAICRVLNATLATRNTTDFTGTGVSLINPWKAVESSPK
jgi:predicted nucleic acid-binding protein